MKISEHRAKAFLSNAHARSPEIVASLQSAFELYLEFCVASGAITAIEASRLGDRCWDALKDTAAAQARHQGEMEPTARFLTLVCSVLSSGRAHLENRTGGVPDQWPRACGWRTTTSGDAQPQGDCIGWVDGDDLYLEPASAYRAAQVAARESQEPLSVTEQTLKKRLREKNLLASTDRARQMLTVRRMIGGSQKDVLHFHRLTILPELADAREDAE